MNTLNIMIIIGLLAMLVLSIVRAELQQKQPIVAIQMDEEGMHRKLTYQLQFHKTIVDMHCKYVLWQPLPAAVYISTDELDDLQRLEMLDAIYPKFVDVEIITEKASPFAVILRGAVKETEDFTLPIHFRYHAASDKSTSISVEIGKPQLYLNCPNGDKDNSIATELRINPDKLHCLDQEQCNLVEQHLPDDTGDCNWFEVDTAYRLEAPLQAEIPVGNAKAFSPVLYATIVLSWTVSVWSIWRSLENPRRINRELREKKLKLS